jgi:excinuclease ABC subunit A
VSQRKIILKNVNVHNLKSISLELDHGQLILFTGVSGSGKSSLAFDTLYVEGQRRYIESLSTQARRQMTDMAKPDVEHTEGITPTISIEQKTAGRNPRSTVGTMTEIYDYLRVLYARVGVPHCPVSGEPVAPQSRERIIKTVQSLPPKTKLIILAPYAKQKKGEFKDDFQDLLRKGYTRARIDGKMANLEEPITLDGNVAHTVEVLIDRIVISTENNSRIAEALTNALQFNDGSCITVDADTEEETFYSMHAFSLASGISYSSLEPQDFSFNSPSGMCPRCQGLGMVNEYIIEKIVDPKKSIAEDCFIIGSSYNTVRYGNIYDNLARLYNFSVHTPWEKLPPKAQNVFLQGTEKKWTRMHLVHPDTGATWTDHVQWRGILYEAHSRYSEATSDSYRRKMEMLMSEQTCPECHGERLKPYPAATQFCGKRIYEMTHMTVSACLAFFEKVKLSPSDEIIAEELLKEISQRLYFLNDVGLHYLTLDRTAPTLSGGEAQRVRLASQIGCGLVGITYILDEPSIGLHPRDNKRLIETLKRLRDMGNTVIVVEHDEETILEADHIVDFGPGPGVRGGEIVVSGTLKDLLKNKDSYTGAYLLGTKEIPVPKKRRKPTKEVLKIQGAAHHNLKNVNVDIPLGLFIAVTGVSGSGKSSLITEILYPALSNELLRSSLSVGTHKALLHSNLIDKVIAVDQTPIGRNPRSNPATYIKLFDDIRDLYAQLPESQARGYKSGRFSFNVKEGSCPRCEGMGMIKIDMDFLEDAWADCPVCHTQRFDHETLSILYKGKNIYNVLEMEVDEAAEFFQNIPHIFHKLNMLQKVGLGYIKIGQFSTTLSGGEAQRVKLAKELVRPPTGKTLYILDEPTTGLHFHDIKHLLEVLHELVERGNTVLVIEHNMDVVKTADWIIDMGPDGGEQGGLVVATGAPEKISKMETPTGEALKTSLTKELQKQAQNILKEPAKAKKKRKNTAEITSITIEGAEQNNLKHVDAVIPREKLTILTGPSGSGKSSLAFETIYAEGQRRYVESLSPYARQFVKQLPKPKVAGVEGLSPAIAIEQKVHAGNPRSTVGTMTEIYDYLRLLYARIGIPHSPETGEVIKSISKDFVVEKILTLPEGEKIQILAPLSLSRTVEIKDVIFKYQRLGYLRVRFDGVYYDINDNALLENYDKKRKHELMLIVDRLKVIPTIMARLDEAIASAAQHGEGKLIVAKETSDLFFNLSFAVESTGKSYPPITPQTFAFNHAEGMCMECLGLGYQYGANLAQDNEFLHFSTAELMNKFWPEDTHKIAWKLLTLFLEEEKISWSTPLCELSTKHLGLLMNGSPENKFYIAPEGWKFQWRGINNVLAKAGKSGTTDVREMVVPLLEEHTCPSCNGARLNPLARNVTIHDVSIDQLCNLPLKQALLFIENLNLPQAEKKWMEEIQRQLLSRLRFLCEVGLHYLALGRKAPTLSGGETQRIRLARQLGSGLTGVLYVLDEPTIGLHPRDNARLNAALQQLKDLKNTLIMVEHDPLTIATADYILDFGPHSGIHGGHITARGTYKEILRNPNSLTGQYLSGKKVITLPKKRSHKSTENLSIKNATLHNLKKISVNVPVGLLTCLTGVSGSGKSTLMHRIILPALKKGIERFDSIDLGIAIVKGIENFDKVIYIDQNPIGLTSRSDVGTYVDLLSRVRDFFSTLPLARTKGLKGKNFSYNHRRGMCTACWGMGYRKVEMHFLPAVRVKCEECQGLRLNPVSLEVTYQGKNFGQFLNYTVDEAKIAFENHPRIVRILDTLISVGLGYLKIGQEMASLSGGEAQRIKLSRELAKRSSGKTIYLLDEPTTGLHSDDIDKLLNVLNKLVDKGNTVLVIEHNSDVIRNADYVIDLGPDAGDEGGQVVFTGTPENLAKSAQSLTGKFLAK